MKNSLFICLSLLLFGSSVKAQSLEFEFLDADEISNNCTSVTNPETNVQCYAVKYTPGSSGTLTSYTLGFIGTCAPTGSPFLTDGSNSCIMTDNSSSFDACNEFELFLIQLSGNTGTTSISEGVPIVVHQVCFNIVPGDTVVLEKDETSGHTFSIDPDGGGDPFTDVPVFVTEELTNEFSCEESTFCSINFGLAANKVVFTLNPEGNIVDAENLDNTFGPTQSFDIYDELNSSCTSSGGIADISFDFQILNTIDINGNGLIDTLAGSIHNVTQDTDGIIGAIPFNVDDGSESSAGDIRGYSIQVKFANHIGIIADQLTVDLEGINSAGTAFESAALIFQDEARNDYGSVLHHGYFGGENDLTGSCDTTYAGINFDVTGSGVVVFQDTAVVDKNLPCNIGLGVDGVMDSPSINARLDAGLDSAAVISGFKLIVFGEDVAAPNDLDDGSGIIPDDGIRGNAITSTISSLSSTIKGITITGCVFVPLILPLNWVDINARASGENITLDWTTDNEINTEYFEIEWSKGGRDFEVIGDLEANNSSGTNSYSWIHKNPASKFNYYRIKQVDLDGKYSYSKIVSASINRASRFSIYPNPASQVLKIRSDRSDAPIHVQIFDISGMKVLEVSTESKSIDLASLTDGLYYMIASVEKERYNLKFIKSE